MQPLTTKSWADEATLAETPGKLEVDDDWVRGTLRLTASGVSFVPLEGGQPRQIPIGTLLRVVTHDRRRRWKKARPCVELWAATGTKATFDCRDDRRRKAFSRAAQKALEDHATGFKPSDAGIGGLARRRRRRRRRHEGLAEDTREDLKALAARAGEVVSVLKRYGNASAASAFCVADAEAATVDTSDARQLAASAARVAERLLERRPTCSLADLWCAYNRARGVSLVSPDDLADACARYLAVGAPRRLEDAPVAMRTLRSGVRVIYNAGDDVPGRVAAAVPPTGASAPAVARALRVPAALGLEHCLDAEAAGRLCRDAGPAGLAFFPNRFLA